MHAFRPMIVGTILLSAMACLGNERSAADITGTKPTTPPLASVELTPDSAQIVIGDSVHLGKVLRTASGETIKESAESVEWVSSDTTIARVTNVGTVYGLKTGLARISIRIGRRWGRGTVTVKPPTTPTTPTTPTEPTAPTTPTTPTTPTEPTAPTTPTAPTNQAGLSGKAFMYDDFRQYANSTALRAKISTIAGGTSVHSAAFYNDGHNANLAEIDQTVLYNGHATLKYNMPGGTADVPQLWAPFPNQKTVNNFWFRVKIRYSPGFSTQGVTPGQANAYKVLGWGWAGVNGRGGFGFTNTDQYNLVFSVQGTTQKGGQGDQLYPARAGSAWTDGQWYEYIIHYEQLTSTTVRQRWWMAKDGQTPVLQGTQTETMSLGNAPVVDRIMIGQNFNSARASGKNQALWYGQWEVVDGSQHASPFGVK